MKTHQDILLLGDPRLYEVCAPVLPEEFSLVAGWVSDLGSAMRSVRSVYGFGRAIAAPQLGIMKRIIYMEIDKPLVFINPTLDCLSEEMFEVWDDCMSFPHLLVKLRRHKRITIRYVDENGASQSLDLEDDLSELLQHEYDHLEGVLCTMRAIDERSFRYRRLRGLAR